MMKDDEKFADEVFEKISAYERKKKKRRRVLAGVLSGGFACAFTLCLIPHGLTNQNRCLS